MKPTEFVKVNTQFWGDHLKSVSDHLPGSHAGELPGQLLYPRMMVLTETPDWNILELVGVSREYRALEVRRHKAQTIEEYFGLAEGSPVVSLAGENIIKDATVATQAGRGELDARFPSAQKMRGTEYVGPGDQLLRFAPGNYTTFDRALLVHGAGPSIRVHWTFFAVAIHRSEPADKYVDFLRNFVTAAPHLDPVGTLSAPRGDEGVKSAAFTSTYLAHGLQDATVEEFLTEHESILLSAFDATRLIPRPILEWQDGESTAGALTPDFVLERADGTHIIGDLGLPLREPGKKHRRSTTVGEGTAQLARYDDYFSTPENRAFAQTKYGVSDPRKVLVISSQQTVAAGEPTADIIDYDTILRLYLAAKS